MTLPFRRRHHDAEATHDRARSLSSRRLLEPLEDDDAAWLARHLDACTECRREDEGFAADQGLLRSLREKPIEPPRDLWARTSAALDREAGSGLPLRAGGGSTPTRPRNAGSGWRVAPLGAIAAVAAVFVIVLSSVFRTVVPPSIPNPTTGVAFGSSSPGPTPIDLVARIPVIRTGADGSWDVYVTDVDQVCPQTTPECAPPPDEHKVSAGIVGAKPSTVTVSPASDQLVYETGPSAASSGRILIVPLREAAPQSPPPSTSATVPPVATPPVTEPPVTETPGSQPPSGEPASPPPSPEPTPEGAIEIASGVTIVGEAAYSPDGNWLVFSAAPSDGAAGPDLYLYRVGDASAMRVTDDHETYFSAWLGGQVLASRVTIAPGTEPTVGPDGTAAPGAPTGPSDTTEPSDTTGPSDTTEPGQTTEPQPAPPIEGTASSFLLEPGALARTELTQGDVWMPVVDPQSRDVVYWSGDLLSSDRGMTWQLGDGQLVLDGWSSAAAQASAPPESTAPVETDVASTAAPTAPVVGPAGHPVPLVDGQVEDFRAKFDPSGAKLAIWVAEHVTDPVGRLHLVAIDPSTGAANPVEPLPATPSLRRFSIDANRLAWVSPPGQDGQESSLQVLGWNGDEFGEIQTEPAAGLVIVQ